MSTPTERFSIQRLHPRAADSLESERCPDCGRPGLPTGATWAGIEEWACPECEPKRFEERAS